jgi:hypothetical protein
MNNEDLCNLLKENTYLVNVYLDSELISQGTAICINENGDLLTAAHVISGKLPVQEKDILNIRIEARAEGKSFEPYSMVTCGLSFSLPMFIQPITIDLSVLKNQLSVDNRPFLKIKKTVPKIGESVIMAGYSDEVYTPFAIEKNLDYNYKDFQGHQEEIQSAFEKWMRFSMYKSGMIGRVYPINIKDSSNDLDFTANTFYVDNGMHSGASGGPVIDKQGNLIGVITQRAITSLSTSINPELEVPSGSTIAISPNTILDYINALKDRPELIIPWHTIDAT